MGIAASLFFNTNSPKDSLDWRIRPSDDQYAAQVKRWNELGDYLIEDLKARSGCSISSWLQGSYKFGTQVRPALHGQEFDIDLGIYFRWVGDPEDGEHRAAALKKMVQASLLKYMDSEDNDAEAVSEPKQRCNRIHFADNFHIDVPSYHLDPDDDVRSLATERDVWESSDPKAIYKWWKEKIGEDARPRRLVRYLKMWSALNLHAADAPSSILTTVLVADAYLNLDATGHSGDDEFLRAITILIKDRLSEASEVDNPIDASENLNRLTHAQTEKLVERLGALVSVADRAIAAATKAQSAEIWAEVYKHFFPLPEDAEVIAEVSKSMALVPLTFTPVVDVVARPYANAARIFQGVDSIGPIPKDCEITFKLRNWQNVPNGATVYWTVRNEGEEAEERNDLGHVSATGISATENSAYVGTHHMDVAVKLNGALIGRKRVPVTIQGIKIPPRNTKRPEYVKYRSKRK